MKELTKDNLIKLLSAGRFPNNKNRIWTMCQVALKLCLQCVDEAEKNNLTNEQFYIAFEDCLNKVSTKDHKKYDQTIVNDFKSFNADSGVE
nr:MAG TPA: hypothetical protein [Caudoviricetes sp.]